jgi:hypothetical protein
MVRSDGKRSPESTDVLVAEVFWSPERKEYTVPLRYFSEDPKQEYYVRLRPARTVHPCVLDLCVYDPSGLSQIELESPCPENVLPAWKAKYKYLKKHVDSILRDYESFGGEKIKDNQARNYVMTESPKHFPVFTSNSGLFTGTMSFVPGQRGLSFNCKRVKRLQRAHALAIFLEYMQCLTRPAFDRDLTT